MKVLILYRPLSEHGRTVEEYIHEFTYRHPEQKIETLTIDTREGAAMASLYDILQYPAILVTTDDGAVQQAWVGERLPLMDEVLGYARV